MVNWKEMVEIYYYILQEVITDCLIAQPFLKFKFWLLVFEGKFYYSHLLVDFKLGLLHVQCSLQKECKETGTNIKKAASILHFERDSDYFKFSVIILINIRTVREVAGKQIDVAG